MPDVTDYDQSGYDYIKYWKDRQYEHAVERHALTTLLPASGDNLLDVGGGFGRLAQVYCPRFQQCTILDYSKNLLQQAQKWATQKGFTNLITVQGDAYHLTFAENSFDCVLLIRVLHHLEKPELVLAEISRVLTPDGYLILEIANKINLKATLRAFFKGNFNFRQHQDPIKFSTQTIQGQEGIFYNYHPEHILQLLEKNNFVLEKKLSVSNLRIPLIKKILPLSLLLSLDTIIQPLFTHFIWGPSLWLQCRKNP